MDYKVEQNKTKRKKIKLKRSVKIFICLLLLLICLIFLINTLFISHSYSLEYNIDDYDISENYDKKEEIYYYEIKNNNHIYNFITSTKYQKEKKLITNITKYEQDDYTCLVIESNIFEVNPLCSKGDENIDYRLVPEDLELPISNTIEPYETNYENYYLYNTDNNILVWQYKGFIYFNKDKIKTFDLFTKDIYDINLAVKINNYLVIPDYEQNYNFNKLYIINLSNQKIEEWEIDYDISFDSYILGTNNKSIYLVDKKNKIEYEIVPHKKKMRIVASNNKKGIIYNEGKEESISLNSLISSNQSFTYKNNYQYTLQDNTLYLSYLDTDIKTKISDQKISSIVSINEDNIYYLVEDTLYKYNLYYGEVKLIEYDDWEFNYNNLIFLNN